MNSNLATIAEYPEDEIAELVNTLDRTQRRLQELAGGGLDAVSLPGGHFYLLHEAQEKLRQSEAAQTAAAALQASILNALPAHIAIIDHNGTIISVNEGWRRYSESNGLVNSDSILGVNYPDICEKALGDQEEEALCAAAGIRAVMSGAVRDFSYDYPCHSPAGQQWYRLMVSPMEKDGKTGAVVMHLDITARVRAEERLRQSQALLAMASRVGRLGGWALDLRSRALSWSDEVRAIHEAPEDFVPTVETGIDFYAPEFRDAISEAVAHCISDGTPFDLELQIITTKGRRVWVRAIGEMLRDDTGASSCVQGAFQDITDRKAAERELIRINRALTMLSKCNETLIRAEREQDLLDQICGLAVEAGGYRMAWVGYRAEDEYRSVTPAAHAGMEEGYLQEVKVSWSADLPNGLGPGGRAIREGRAVLFDDLSLEPGFSQFLPSARRRGYSGLVSLPLRDGKETFGMLGLYSAEVKTTSAEELKLLQELADNLAFGIVNLRARAGQRRVEIAVLKVAASVSAASGSDFFEQLARGMADALGAQAGFVAQFLPGEPLAARTLAAVAGGQVMANFDYAIEGTPCEILLISDTCVIAKDVSRQLPPGLEALGAQGYVGQRLDSSTGHPLGQLSVVFREPLQDARFITSTIQIFAARAAVEIERRETDAHVREQAALLDNARDAILVRDLDHRVLYWNRGAERLYGWTALEALGQPVTGLFVTDPAPYLAATETTLAAGEWVGELHQVAKDGRPLVAQVHWSLVRDAGGAPKSILCINSDITERKQMEEQFFRAQRLESIGTLASGLAHDLNNILAPIMMCAPLLRHDLPREEANGLLTAIETSAARGAQIVRQVLTFGRGVQGERAPLRIGSIIQEIVQIAVETFPKSVRIEAGVASDTAEFLGDATQWHQVFMNLFVNARDAMPDGGLLSITAGNFAVDAHYASMTPGLSEGPHIFIQVSDTGAGIPPEVAGRIFDPFFTTKEVGKGTGLGLSTVLGIVKNHGGIINLASRPGNGTTFRIIVPVAAGAVAASAGEPEAPIPLGAGKTILIADDEPQVRNATRAVLEKHGYHALLAADGIEALALFAEQPAAIDAVLTDISMPHMDGIALIHTLRRIRPGIPIITSTGQGESERLEALNLDGIDTTLRKPYKAGLLLRALDAAIKAAPEESADKNSPRHSAGSET